MSLQRNEKVVLFHLLEHILMSNVSPAYFFSMLCYYFSAQFSFYWDVFYMTINMYKID